MVSIAHVPTGEERGEPSIGEKRALIDRIASSAQLRRSARLRDFLLYVGGQSLKEGCPEIHEQEIGSKVFGRDSSYDRSQDNIVRVNATELRKRIDTYFLTEGLHEALVLEIPRGAYKPIFRPRTIPIPVTEQATSVPSPQTIVPASPPPVEVASSSRRLNRASILWFFLSLGLALVCIFLWQQNRALRSMRRQSGGPTVSALWNNLIGSGQQTDVVLPDASVILSEEFLGKPMPLGSYLNHDYTGQAQAADVSADRRADVRALFTHNLVALGDFHAAQTILDLAPDSRSLHLTLARFYPAESVKRDNVVLIGGKKANPWVRLFDDGMNFSLDYDVTRSRAAVINRHPQAGEQASYSAPMDANSFVGYSVVAYLPNPSKTGKVIILAGTDSDATSGAAEFLTSEEALAKFQSIIHTHGFPYFEVVLKTARLSGASFNAEVVAYRTYR
jgi:hypothetical protein